MGENMVVQKSKRVRLNHHQTTFCPVERGSGPFSITVKGDLAEKIRACHAVAHGSSLQEWCEGVLENFVREHRSGKFIPDPTRHWDRNGEDSDYVTE